MKFASKQVLPSFSGVSNSKLKLVLVGWQYLDAQKLGKSWALISTYTLPYPIVYYCQVEILAALTVAIAGQQLYWSCCFQLHLKWISKFLLNMKTQNPYFSIQQLLTCSVFVNSVKADWEREEWEKSVAHVNLADFAFMLPKPMPLFGC